MPKNTRLSGHELQAEGAPFGSNRVRISGLGGGTSGVGRAMCSCRELSDELPNGTQRRNWHRVHKAQIWQKNLQEQARAARDSPSTPSSEEGVLGPEELTAIRERARRAISFLETTGYARWKDQVWPSIEDLSTVLKVLESAQQAEHKAENSRMVKILDNHLPTIITGLGTIVNATMYLNRDELTEDVMAARAAYSAAHWIAKDIATGGGKPLYDLPSVLDLLGTKRSDDARIEELTGGLAAAKRERDATDAAINHALTLLGPGGDGLECHEYLVAFLASRNGTRPPAKTVATEA